MESNDCTKFIDLCCGIGGFHIGLQPFQCVLACDINKNCRISYENNYNIICKDDIFNLDIDNIPTYNILCAGFPCQPFSQAGLKKGFSDNRSKVYFQIRSIIKKTNPDIVILENVKNLLTLDNGNVITKIRKDIMELDYNVNYTILNTCNFGLAQNRERVFIVCVSRKKYDNLHFNFNYLNSIKIKKCLRDTIDLQNKNYIDSSTYTIIDKQHLKPQKSGIVFCGYINDNNIDTTKNMNLSRSHRQPYRIYHINGINPTLSSGEISGRNYIYDGVGVRKLSITECLKIMGFPSNYKLHSKTTVNYSQIGNSISPVIVNYLKQVLIKQCFI